MHAQSSTRELIDIFNKQMCGIFSYVTAYGTWHVQHTVEASWVNIASYISMLFRLT